MVRFDSSEMGPSQWADGIAKVKRDLETYERERLPMVPEQFRAQQQERLDSTKRGPVPMPPQKHWRTGSPRTASTTFDDSWRRR